MSENPWVVLVATVVIVALSAFFVAVEFAALAAKRHRLEEAAPGRRPARGSNRSTPPATSRSSPYARNWACRSTTTPAVRHRT